MKKLLYILLLFFIGNIFSQEEKPTWKFKDNVVINGYVKYLPSVSFTGIDNFYTNILIHNRINIKAYVNDNFTAKLSLRNRITYGELVKLNPNYSKTMDVDNGELDLSFLLVDQEAFIIHSIIDRAYVDYAKGKWQIRLGRQRINWGINLAWNTNDLFNAYNIVDFDYEEKAGADAVRVQYFIKNSNLDFAYKLGKDMDNSVVALMYKFNKYKYDFQVLAANYNTDLAIGAGWAGNLKKAGFKGESTLFIDKNNSDKVFSTSTSVDYYFQKGLYLNGTFLYTSNGETSFNPSVLNFIGSTLSAKKLMPTKYSYLLQASKEFNPRFKSSITTIYGAGMDLLFVMPSVDYSIKQNWDLNLTGQLFYAKTVEKFDNLNNSIYLRLQYSF